MAQRMINGQMISGTDEQLDLREFGELLIGESVEFPFHSGGTRIGKVKSYGLTGGGNRGWILELLVIYRGSGAYVTLNEIELI